MAAIISTTRAAHWRAVSSAMPRPTQRWKTAQTTAQWLTSAPRAALRAGTRARSPAAAWRRPSATVKPAIPIWAALRASTAVLFSLPTRRRAAPCAATAMSAALRASTWAVTLRQARASSSAQRTTALARWRPTSTRAAWPVPTSAAFRCPASCKAVSPQPTMRAAWPVSIRIRAAFTALTTPTARSWAASLPPTTRAAWPVRTVPKSPAWRTVPRCAPAQNMRAVLRARTPRAAKSAPASMPRIRFTPPTARRAASRAIIIKTR